MEKVKRGQAKPTEKSKINTQSRRKLSSIYSASDNSTFASSDTVDIPVVKPQNLPKGNKKTKEPAKADKAKEVVAKPVENAKDQEVEEEEKEEIDEDKIPGLMICRGGFNNGFNVLVRSKGDPLRVHVSGEHLPGKANDRNMCFVKLGDKHTKLPSRVEKGSKPAGGVWKESMYLEEDLPKDEVKVEEKKLKKESSNTGNGDNKD